MTGTLFRSNVAPTEGIPLPLALTGLRKEIEGQPCHYRRHKILSARTFTHRGDGTQHDVTRDRLAALVDAFNKRKAKGLRPFVPDRHTLEPKATENFGWVENLELSGDDLYADLQLIGDDALKLAARNNVSLLTTADALDADGVKYPEVVHHVALTPNEALSDLGGFIRIAASAGGSAAIEAPILEPAAPLQEHPMFKPETLKNLRAKLKLPDTTPEADVAEQAAALALKDPPADKTAEVTALSADVQRLTGELDAANKKALALSASAPKQPDPEMMRDRADNYTQRLDLMSTAATCRSTSPTRSKPSSSRPPCSCCPPRRTSTASGPLISCCRCSTGRNWVSRRVTR
jgi:hypothetical protein